jgi:hypothetical protein
MLLLCAGVVDVCLIPEVSFSLEKLLAYLGEVLNKKGNAVVCVAEGAGQVRGLCLCCLLGGEDRASTSHGTCRRCVAELPGSDSLDKTVIFKSSPDPPDWAVHEYATE